MVQSVCIRHQHRIHRVVVEGNGFGLEFQELDGKIGLGKPTAGKTANLRQRLERPVPFHL